MTTPLPLDSSPYLSAIRCLVAGDQESIRSATKVILNWDSYTPKLSGIKLSRQDLMAIATALGRLLSGGNIDVRAAAADVAGELGPDAAIPEVITGLAKLLADYKNIRGPNLWQEGLRETTLKAIAKLGPRAASSPELMSILMTVFQDPGGGIECSAAEVLGSICAEAVPAEVQNLLEQSLADPQRSPMYALRLFKALGAVGATERNLMRLAQILPRGHQIEALETIERLGQVAATPEILNALESLASEADREIEQMGARLKSMEDPGGYPWWMTESSREAHSMTEMSLGYSQNVRARAMRVLSQKRVLLPFDTRLDAVSLEFDRLIASLCGRPDELYSLSPRRFEELIAEVWHRMGYKVELTPATRDGGRDIIATRYAETRSQVLIECKKYNPRKKVGIDVLQRLLGAVFQYRATQGVVTTTSTFTRDAIQLIGANPYQLTGHDFKDVTSLLWRVHLIIVPTPELWHPR